MREPVKNKEVVPAQVAATNDSVMYYLERGLLVFTEAHHRARGYCCKNGCRHCPYGYRNKK